MKIMTAVLCFVLSILVGASFTEAGRRAVSVPVGSVVQRISDRGFAGSSVARVSDHRRATVKDRRYATECGPQFASDVCDGSQVHFAGFGDCDAPVSATREASDCGSTKTTEITFRSGKSVTIRSRANDVRVDYDRR